MRFPSLTVLPTSRSVIEAWMGYNRNPRIGDGELFDMENLSSDRFPVLAPRKPRGVYAAPTGCTGLIAKDTLCYTDGNCFVMDGYRLDMGLDSREKSLVSMGAYVIILPDKKYVNTADLTDWGNIEASFVSTQTVSFTLCTLDGAPVSPDYSQPEAPENPADGALWLDTRSAPAALRQWSESTGLWAAVPTTYVKITSANLGKAFEAGDGVSISGLAGTLLDAETGVEIQNPGLGELEGSFVIQARGDDYIVVIGLLESPAAINSPVTVERRMPNMDFVIESENRLWGCRYGLSAGGQVVNEIYASKLGDFKNWNCFQGVSTDSYVVSLGTDGAFTGAVNHLGFPLFFKENCIHKVYGSYPAAYQTQTVNCRGVQRGSEKSLAAVGEVLYYKSSSGVCAYDGSLPREVSAPLGDTPYHSATAAGLGNKYYISMADPQGVYHLFVFDTARGLWHREDNTRAGLWCRARNELYFLDCADGKIKTVLGTGEKAEEAVSWMAQTGCLGLSSPDSKYISRLNLRLRMDPGAKLTVYIDYDSEDRWTPVCTLECGTLRSFTVPVRLRRCGHFRLRLEGRGDVQLYSIVKTLENGSDTFHSLGQTLGGEKA